MFKIFFSWQSDLSGKNTKNFIRKCIDEAIVLAEQVETVEAQRDEATTGMTGSPDIVSSLFSKIDNCDMFIADVSLCYTEDIIKEKRSPNPNVLLELGYAVKTLGWDRILCFCNTDYGEAYPFDIAHNRITNYSLNGKNSNEIRAELAKIIFINIRDIRKSPERAKSGLTAYVIGAYDYDTHQVVNELRPVFIGEQYQYTKHNNDLISQSKDLLSEIQKMVLPPHIIDTDVHKDSPVVVISPAEGQEYSILNNSLTGSFRDQKSLVKWETIREDKALITKWLDIDVSDDFFDLGGLEKSISLLSINGPSLIGTNEEKEKYDLLGKLSYNLSVLNIRTDYITTFSGMVFIPIAVYNLSTTQDNNIRIVVTIENGEIVEPTKYIICKSCEGLFDFICHNDDTSEIGLIEELFSLYEDGIIHNANSNWNPYTPSYRLPTITPNGTYYSKNEDDYESELQDYIASSSGERYYVYEIDSIRPGECKWLNPGMLIKPDDDLVVLHYHIYSTHSSGNLEGTLSLNMNKFD